jgi:CRISPR-associated endoribonuclease Cas6
MPINLPEPLSRPKFKLRLLLKLVPKKSHPYVNDYHYHLQAAIYSLIREGGLQNLHEKRGYKFFCFSNIFPFGNFEQGIERNLLVSSPDHAIIEAIQQASSSKMRSGDAFFVGELQFAISGVSRPFRINLEGTEPTVRSATPIVMRIPRAKYEEYGIRPKIDYDYVFWRASIPFEAFVTQLQDNIAKKWKDYISNKDVNKSQLKNSRYDELRLRISRYRFIKTVSKPVTLRKKIQPVIGSIWDMQFRVDSLTERFMLEFAIDCGFGEKNSLGFGFINMM